MQTNEDGGQRSCQEDSYAIADLRPRLDFLGTISEDCRREFVTGVIDGRSISRASAVESEIEAGHAGSTETQGEEARRRRSPINWLLPRLPPSPLVLRQLPPCQLRLLKKASLTAVALILAILIASFVWRTAHPTRQSAARQFTVAENFTVVRKILVRKDAAKQIVTMGGDSEFVEQKWQELKVDPGQKQVGEGLLLETIAGDGDWALALLGNLKVRTLDEYIGQHVITLQQRVEINPDLVDSHVQMQQPTERLKAYEMTTRFSRTEANQTLVELSLEQEILTNPPWFAHRIADRRVKDSVERALENQQAAIERVIEENKDDVPLLPLR